MHKTNLEREPTATTTATETQRNEQQPQKSQTNLINQKRHSTSIPSVCTCMLVRSTFIRSVVQAWDRVIRFSGLPEIPEYPMGTVTKNQTCTPYLELAHGKISGNFSTGFYRNFSGKISGKK